MDVLFVSHDAHRSGAPTSLLRLVQWLGETTQLSMAIVVPADGPLVPDFADVAPVSLADGHHLDLFGQADLVYANSTWSHRLVDDAPAFAAPVVTHVRESRLLLSQVNPLRAGKRPRRFIAVSDHVRDVLVGDYPIRPDQVSVCKGFVPVGEVLEASRASTPIDWRDFGVPGDVWVVGAVGSIWPPKGPDLFIRVAEVAIRLRAADDLHFVWIGGNPGQVAWMRDEVDRAELGSRVHVLGEIARPFHLMRAFDMLVLPSREDSFPLVVMEAGVLDRCVVAFDSGGVRELLADGRGVLVGREEIGAMAGEIVALVEDTPRRVQLGADLGTYVRSHHDVDVRAPDVLRVIEQMLI